MLSTAVVILLTLTWATILSCPPSSEITEIQNFRLCNGSTLSIKFNVSESCNNIISQVFLYIYQYSTSFGGNARSHVSWEYFQYSDILCGITARLGSPLIINVDGFNRTNLLQIRLREIFSGSIETCSNTFHVFLDYTGFLGPPVSINSYSDSCSTIDVTWSDPDYQCGIDPVYYNLSIYDAITDSLVTTVAVYGTSYQFVDNNLFIHRYTYVITGVNKLGEGISNNDTFSYQRVPRLAVENTTLEISNYTQDMAIMQYHTLVRLECTGEAPGNITVTIQCNETDVVYTDTILVEYPKQPMNITGSVPVSLYQQCNITVAFSNEAGSSKPFILPFDTTSPLPPYITSSLPTVSVTSTSGPEPDPPGISITLIITTLLFVVLVGLSLLIVVTLLSLRLYWKIKIEKYYKVPHLRKSSDLELDRVISTASYKVEIRPTVNENGDSTYTTFSKTETTFVIERQSDDVSMSYATIAEVSAATHGDSEVITKSLNANEKQQKFPNTTTTTAGATANSRSKALPPQTEASSVLYTDFFDKIISNPTESESDNEVVVSASLAIAIRATGRNTSYPQPVHDKKSKGATTMSQEVNSETDTLRTLPHHVDDPFIDETQARTPTDNNIATDVDEKEKVATIDGTETSNASSSQTQTNCDDHKQVQPLESNQSSQSVSPIQSLALNEEASVNKDGTNKLTPVVQSTDISTDATKDNYVRLVVPRRSSLPEGSQYCIVAL